MEKRLLIFLVLAVAIFWVSAKINPQKPPVPQPVPPAGTEENGPPSKKPVEPIFSRGSAAAGGTR